MDNRKFWLKISLLLGVLLFLGILFLVPVSTTTTSEVAGTASSGDSGGSNFIFLIPIWVAVFVPLLVKKRRDKEQEVDIHESKRKSKPKDRFTMMKEMVEDLDDDELAYLEKRLMETHGDVFEGEAYVS